MPFNARFSLGCSETFRCRSSRHHGLEGRGFRGRSCYSTWHKRYFGTPNDKITTSVSSVSVWRHVPIGFETVRGGGENDDRADLRVAFRRHWPIRRRRDNITRLIFRVCTTLPGLGYRPSRTPRLGRNNTSGTRFVLFIRQYAFQYEASQGLWCRRPCWFFAIP